MLARRGTGSTVRRVSLPQLNRQTLCSACVRVRFWLLVLADQEPTDSSDEGDSSVLGVSAVLQQARDGGIARLLRSTAHWALVLDKRKA